MLIIMLGREETRNEDEAPRWRPALLSILSAGCWTIFSEG
jgi:hypothetical protein